MKKSKARKNKRLETETNDEHDTVQQLYTAECLADANTTSSAPYTQLAAPSAPGVAATEEQE